MYFYKASIQYDGTLFKGFQHQVDQRTVQNELVSILGKILGGRVVISGASRTDSGVHALGQFIKITSENFLDPQSLKLRLKELLPKDMRFLDLEETDSTFNPIKMSASKEYRYFFTTGAEMRQLGESFIANYPYDLDIPAINKCVGLLVGKHDFKNFCVTGSNVKSTHREILKAELNRVNPHEVIPGDLFPLPDELKECFEFRIEGTGFLKQMVRLIVAALWQVGRGRITEEEFKRLLAGEEHHSILKASTPRGLYLYKVRPKGLEFKNENVISSN